MTIFLISLKQRIRLLTLLNWLENIELEQSIWTQNLEKAEELSTKIGSGMVTVNNVVISDPCVPLGVIKNSGFGRELSRYGMLEFVNIKSVRFYDELIHGPYVE